MKTLYQISHANNPKNLFTYLTSRSDFTIWDEIHSLFIQPSSTILALSRYEWHNSFPIEFQRLIVFTEKPSFSFDTNESHSYFVNNFLKGILPKFLTGLYFISEGICEAYEINLGLRIGVTGLRLKNLLILFPIIEKL